MFTENFNYDSLERYIILQHGTGDSINNLIPFFYYYKSEEYILLAPLDQKNLIDFISKIFNRSFKKIIYFDHPAHGVMNLLMPENQHLPWRKGFPSTIPGELCDMWQDPKLIPLKLPVPIEFIESHITRFQNEILKENNKNLFIPSNSIILFPTMSTKNNIIPNSMWLKLSEVSKEKGYTVFTNISGKNRYDEYIVENTQPINLNYEELAKLAILNPGTRYIMLRSGISDFLRLFGGTALIFYPSEPTWYWGNCKMSHVKYSKMLSTEIIFTGNAISEEPLAKALLEDFLN